MSLKKTLASTLVGGLVAGAAMVAAAGPAAAIDEGTQLSGGIGWFDTVGPLSAQSPATQIFDGAGTARPWATLTTENPCPAGATQMYVYVRIPQPGVPENEWTQVSLGGAITTSDADGRFYSTTTSQADRIAQKSEVQTYTAANGGAGDFPFLAVCRDNTLASLGYFETTIHVAVTDFAMLSDATWNLVDTPANPAWHVTAPASTTTVDASSTSITFGDSVDLTATVAPSDAAGDVEFFAGTTSLGTATVSAGTATLTTAALPVGNPVQVTAEYLGGNYSASTSAALDVVVAPAPAIDTASVLTVDVTSGDAYQAATLTCTVDPAGAAGTARFLDGTVALGTAPVSAGVAVLTTNALGAGAHSLTCEFVPTDSGLYNPSTSVAVDASYTLAGAVDEQTVVVTIPVGTISITTPYTPEAPLDLGTAVLDTTDSTYSASAPFGDITITDTRAGNLGFTASVVSSSFVSASSDSFGGIFAGLTDLAATQVTGNALQASNVTLTNHAPAADGLDVPKVFAHYNAGLPLGTAQIAGTFGIDQVPTSVTPGLYTATVTFTAV